VYCALKWLQNASRTPYFYQTQLYYYPELPKVGVSDNHIQNFEVSGHPWHPQWLQLWKRPQRSESVNTEIESAWKISRTETAFSAGWRLQQQDAGLCWRGPRWRPHHWKHHLDRGMVPPQLHLPVYQNILDDGLTLSIHRGWINVSGAQVDPAHRWGHGPFSLTNSTLPSPSPPPPSLLCSYLQPFLNYLMLYLHPSLSFPFQWSHVLMILKIL